jgi:small subunit ribosomal protein S5
VRAIVETAGIQDILTKSLGSKNPQNVVKATMDGLTRLRTAETARAQRGLPPLPPKADAPAKDAPARAESPESEESASETTA